MLIAQIETAQKLIDHAADKGGQYFLVVAVAGMAVAIVWMARAFQVRHDKLAQRLDQVQDQHTKYLEQEQGELVATLKENSSAMLQFAHALSPITRMLEGHARSSPNLP